MNSVSKKARSRTCKVIVTGILSHTAALPSPGPLVVFNVQACGHLPFGISDPSSTPPRYEALYLLFSISKPACSVTMTKKQSFGLAPDHTPQPEDMCEAPHNMAPSSIFDQDSLRTL